MKKIKFLAQPAKIKEPAISKIAKKTIQIQESRVFSEAFFFSEFFEIKNQELITRANIYTSNVTPFIRSELGFFISKTRNNESIIKATTIITADLFTSKTSSYIYHKDYT